MSNFSLLAMYVHIAEYGREETKVNVARSSNRLGRGSRRPVAHRPNIDPALHLTYYKLHVRTVGWTAGKSNRLLRTQTDGERAHAAQTYCVFTDPVMCLPSASLCV